MFLKFEDRKVLFDNWRELMNSYEEEFKKNSFIQWDDRN